MATAHIRFKRNFESTFVMLKPDAVKRGLIGEILHRI